MSHGYGGASYVAEDQDYSESECPDGQMLQHLGVDITELYRRKHAASRGVQVQNPSPPPPSVPYYHTHIPGYYEGQNRIAAACGCSFMQDARYCHQYKMNPHVDQDHLYRSMSHAAPNLRTCQDPGYHKPSVPPPQLKKYPVTARTPRYYRQAALCKRPSTLCLPLTCQPDPAVYRSRRCSPDVQVYKGQEVYASHQDASIKHQHQTKKLSEPHQIDSEGDVNSRLNDLENLLTKFDDPDDNQDNDPIDMTGVSDIAKILKPRVPSSIRARQNKVLRLKAAKPTEDDALPLTSDVSKLEVKEFPQSLEMVYRRLSDENISTTQKEDANASDRSSEKNENGLKPFPEGRPPKHFSGEQKPSLDDNSALELHRSKSYIVSLIDKALSKELGTVPGDKCTRTEFLNMNPKRAIDLVNRHTGTAKSFDKSFEKASGSSEEQQTSNGQGKTECASCKNEEPLYLKELKQLRWSHLRHIQREAKRLADLERFLDSFAEGDSLT